MITPLKNPLEGRPTTMRVLRSMNIELSLVEYGQVSAKIYEAFKLTGGMAKKVNQRYSANSKYKKKANCYPADFIPEMKRIITDFINNKKNPKPYPMDDAPIYVIKDKEVKIKRPRIKK